MINSMDEQLSIEVNEINLDEPNTFITPNFNRSILDGNKKSTRRSVIEHDFRQTGVFGNSSRREMSKSLYIKDFHKLNQFTGPVNCIYPAFSPRGEISIPSS